VSGDEWDPDRCACRWGEQPCWLCLPVLAARWERSMQKTNDETQEATR
jgi:hypothetical protein